MRRKHNSDVTYERNAIFEFHIGYCVKTVRSRPIRFQLNIERSYRLLANFSNVVSSIVNIPLLECAPVQSNSFSVYLFPEDSSEVKYITFLLEQNGELLLYLCRPDNSTTEVAITTCEERLRALFCL